MQDKSNSVQDNKKKKLKIAIKSVSIIIIYYLQTF